MTKLRQVLPSAPGRRPDAQLVWIVSAVDPAYARLAELSFPTMRRYADRHGFRFVPTTGIAGPRSFHWHKIDVLLNALDAGAELAVWVDADALFVRGDVDIRDVLTRESDLWMVWHRRDGMEVQVPWFHPHINTGVMACRNTGWMRDFLQAVRATEVVDHSWADQAALHMHLGLWSCLLRGEPDQPDMALLARIGWLDRAWNSIPGAIADTDPIIEHYAGFGAAARRHLMSNASTLADERWRARPSRRREIALRLGYLATVERRVDYEHQRVQQELRQLATILRQESADSRADLLARLAALGDQLEQARDV